jgi:hypothetical protein
VPFAGIGLNFLLRFGKLAVFGDDDLAAGDGSDLAAFFGDNDGARIASDALFQTGGHERRFGDEQRHSLALHVRTHQRAVGVVVFEERNQTGSHGNELLRRNVHVIDALRLDIDEVAFGTAHHAVLRVVAFVVDGRVGLGDDEVFFTIGGEIIEMAGDTTLLHLAVRSFDEAEIVDARERRERGDQTDVRTFGRFNGANAAVVRRVNVADFEAGAIARETARPEGRETALVREFGQRIDLVHELRKLAASEEVAHDGGQCFRIDQLLRSHLVHALIEKRHALFDEAFGAGQADAALVGEQFADGADAA